MLDLITKGEHSARKLNRARILLLADVGKTDGEIAKALHTGTATVNWQFTTINAHNKLKRLYPVISKPL